MKSYKDVDTYISACAKEIQPMLKSMRAIIKKAAPNAEETIGYGIPTYKLNGNLVHFGGAKTHIGFYPGSAGVIAFPEVAEKYNTSKGTIQFPLDKKLPTGLITKIVKLRIKQNLEKGKK